MEDHEWGDIGINGRIKVLISYKQTWKAQCVGACLALKLIFLKYEMRVLPTGQPGSEFYPRIWDYHPNINLTTPTERKENLLRHGIEQKFKLNYFRLLLCLFHVPSEQSNDILKHQH
jgi:hypothetical protein